jgi:hypothetical protein
MTPRPLPWAALVVAIGEAPFEAIRTAVLHDGVEATSRDAFLMVSAAGALLRDLTPPEAPADALHAYGALLHGLYLLRGAGWPVLAVDRPTLERALADAAIPHRVHVESGTAYVQFPERAVWAEPAPGEAHEPLDGCIVTVTEDAVTALAVLGFRPERQGFTTLEATSRLPLAPLTRRPDGSAPFASTLPAGDRAKLRSVASPQELTVLAFLARSAGAA